MTTSNRNGSGDKKAERIRLLYTGVNGYTESASFTALASAQNYAFHCVGLRPEFAFGRAIADDNTGWIEVRGTSLLDLFPAG